MTTQNVIKAEFNTVEGQLNWQKIEMDDLLTQELDKMRQMLRANYIMTISFFILTFSMSECTCK